MMSNCNLLPHVSRAVDDCCAQHDRDYCKGSKVSRREADRKLLACALKNGVPRWKADPVWALVRVFGVIFYRGDA